MIGIGFVVLYFRFVVFRGCSGFLGVLFLVLVVKDLLEVHADFRGCNEQFGKLRWAGGGQGFTSGREDHTFHRGTQWSDGTVERNSANFPSEWCLEHGRFDM